MPKSKRARVFHLTQVTKKTREQKDQLFQNIREQVPEYQHCIVFNVDNMRNNYLKDYLSGISPVDFARAGVAASRSFTIPPGVVYATAGEVPKENDIPLTHTIEPELRRLGVPTRMVKGKVVLGDENGEGEGYVVCKEGEILDSRQTRLLKLFDVCLSEFRIKPLAYWSAATSEVTEIDQNAMDGVEEE
ncbi:hypothetical protein M440DRAFT_1439458 [Trichoderma longibrachiatum ATCC 18648]|uniref:Large ribosomal subunit protein uL10-like insertion domain-containing protein n=1 Tax=Trichoderma longibrachiatum ATCC 18648 TaxID=983965 RepID=A0A2T4C2T1_TRILO|nr:hypothetical protein M440DRAFT_1439458 [Trichoderma longibrachiatum ATCC 18648]